MPSVLFAGVAVADLDVGRPWYERLLGRPPDLVPNETEVAWQVAEAGWLYVVEDPPRAGRALITMIVDDLDDVLAGLDARGIAAEPVQTYGNAVRKVDIVDPDGNRIGFGQVPAD
jgi:catechol 2,3-dioxygenase-like lactoylglutathione lyase family enzyme